MKFAKLAREYFIRHPYSTALSQSSLDLSTRLRKTRRLAVELADENDEDETEDGEEADLDAISSSSDLHEEATIAAKCCSDELYLRYGCANVVLSTFNPANLSLRICYTRWQCRNVYMSFERK